MGNILLVGVGGQGTILAGKLLTEGLMSESFDVKMSEIHGMSQRGGSVSTHVRYGRGTIYSPVIEKGGADLLLSFEKMEALRWLDYLKKGGSVIVNDYEINPTPVLTGNAVYSDGIADELSRAADTVFIDAAGEAKALGNHRVMNIILLGAAIKRLSLENLAWDEIITRCVKGELAGINIKALKRGFELAGEDCLRPRP
jgi:indolepyruvate ferredoxin oxidoreductase beta subunit